MGAEIILSLTRVSSTTRLVDAALAKNMHYRMAVDLLRRNNSTLCLISASKVADLSSSSTLASSILSTCLSFLCPSFKPSVDMWETQR